MEPASEVSNDQYLSRGKVDPHVAPSLTNRVNGELPRLGAESQLHETLGVTYRRDFNDGVELFVAPRCVTRWSEFSARAPEFSVALDGIVFGPPEIDSSGPRVNFNHHEGVDRLATGSTTEQVLIALKMGLMETFSAGEAPHLRIFVNDADQDVCTAVWLLKNHTRVSGGHSEWRINRLVRNVDLLDRTAGAFPIDPKSEFAQELAWIYRPYNEARRSGRLFSMNGQELADIIDAVGERINRHIDGHGERIELDTEFKPRGGGNGWTLVEEVGCDARAAVYHSGVKAFIAFREQSPEDTAAGVFRYSIGKISPFISFPISDLYDELNRAEGISPDSLDRWGGSDIIGGSPRAKGSTLSPPEVERIINTYFESTTSFPSPFVRAD
jgi:hypothetical protein